LCVLRKPLLVRVKRGIIGRPSRMAVWAVWVTGSLSSQNPPNQGDGMPKKAAGQLKAGAFLRLEGTVRCVPAMGLDRETKRSRKPCEMKLHGERLF